MESWQDRKEGASELGSFEKSGNGWVFFCEYEARDLEVYVDDSDGKPDQLQVAFFLSLLPKLPEYESECRKMIAAVDAHDLVAVSFKEGCDCSLAFNWGNGEWGRTVFVRMTAGKVIDANIVSD